jgi:hypothetical protein
MLVGGPDERRLLKHLLTQQQHNPLERPVQNDSHTLPVSINLALQQIIDFVSAMTIGLCLFLLFRPLNMNRMRRTKFLLLLAGWFSYVCLPTIVDVFVMSLCRCGKITV